MKSFVKALAVFGMVAMSTQSLFAQRAGAHVLIKSLHGAVKYVDKEKSSFVLETDEGDFKFVVPEPAKLFRGTEIVSFSNIEREDEATVKYYEDEGRNKFVLSVTLFPEYENAAENGKQNEKKE